MSQFPDVKWPDQGEARRLLEVAADEVSRFYGTLTDRPIGPSWDDGQRRQWLQNHDFDVPRDLASVISGVSEALGCGNLLSAHPRCFGLFNPTPALAGAIADLLSASFNPQLAGNLGGMPQTVDTRTARLDGDGEAALRLALSVLEERPDQVALRGETLLDLGDWYQLGGKTYDATRVYKDAWAALSAPGGAGTAAMSEPSQLYYKPPSSAAKRADKDDDEQIENFVEVEFTVTPEGRVVDTKTVATDGNDAQDKSVQIALRRARYRPRFVDGIPVATKAVRHRQVLYTVIPTTNRSAGS